MAKRIKKAPSAPLAPPRIHKATLAAAGGVIRGDEIAEAEAVMERRAGRDVVVCGQSHRENQELARRIEKTANGSYKQCPPHPTAGPDALPHYQPDPRPPEGHCFYETDRRKSKKAKTS